jgi:S-methylmethionine-dependent homocysteine/selenocysteine methylase
MGAEYNHPKISHGAGRGASGFPEWRLREGPPLLLDGATGTELERRGVDCGLPLWSARALLEAPGSVSTIHAEYRVAGAEILTANTFRTQRRTLETAGIGERAAELTALAVELARRAGAGWVAGSDPTLEDCYRPDLVPDRDALEREHAEHAENLAAAGADLILVETMNSVREARAAARAAAATELPVVVSFVSWRDARLLSGEPLLEAIDAVAAASPVALAVNCLPASSVASCLPALCESDFPFGVYANLGAPEATGEFRRSEDCTPECFADFATSWVEAGARLVGGCCGTTPAHIRAIAEQLGVSAT